MTREDVIKQLCDRLGGDYPLIASTGLMSRELFGYNDYNSHFYMVGSMGLASAIGLGLVLNLPAGRKVFVLDGDASILMGLNNITNIALHQPADLVHIVMDNNAYASCSEEKTASHQIKIDRLADAAGYKRTNCASDAAGLAEAINISLTTDGPILILISIELGGQRDLPRPLDLPLVAKKFKRFISTEYEKIDSK
jgi:phosphonopyruvate decarboxylase